MAAGSQYATGFRARPKGMFGFREAKTDTGTRRGLYCKRPFAG